MILNCVNWLISIIYVASLAAPQLRYDEYGALRQALVSAVVIAVAVSASVTAVIVNRASAFRTYLEQRAAYIQRQSSNGNANFVGASPPSYQP